MPDAHKLRAVGGSSFHARYAGDGSCEVICTRCFLTVGVAQDAAAVRQIVDSHDCPRDRALTGSAGALSGHLGEQGFQWMEEILDYARGHGVTGVSIVLLLVVSALYVFPTAIEFSVLSPASPWLTTLLPGDLIGCVCLVLASGRLRTGALLYLALTGAESYMYYCHIVSLQTIPWITDLVPTLIVAAVILRASRTEDTRKPLA